MTDAASILPYDRSLNREGIAVDQHEGYFRLITPRVANWRTISKWWYFGFVLVGFYVVMPALGAFVRKRAMQFEEIIVTVEFTLVLGILLITAFVHVNHRYVFEITRDRFTITRIMFGNIRRAWIFKRDAVTDVHASAEPGKLIVRATGQEMMDIRLSRDRALVEQVADALNRGMRETAAGGEDLIATAPPEVSAGTRQVLIGISVALAVLAVILGVAIHPAAAWGPVLLAVIPLGIAMGIQEKKFWT